MVSLGEEEGFVLSFIFGELDGLSLGMELGDSDDDEVGVTDGLIVGNIDGFMVSSSDGSYDG